MTYTKHDFCDLKNKKLEIVLMEYNSFRKKLCLPNTTYQKKNYKFIIQIISLSHNCKFSTSIPANYKLFTFTN